MNAAPLKTHFALWLLPRGDAAQRFSLTIASLAQRYQAPGFEPHVTLYSGSIPASADGEARLIAQCSTLATETSPFRVQPSGLAGGPDYYRHLYIQLASCRALTTLRGAQRGPYMPHLSLLYRQPELRDESGYARHLSNLSLSPFQLARLALIRLGPEVEDWRVLGRWPLSGT